LIQNTHASGEKPASIILSKKLNPRGHNSELIACELEDKKIKPDEEIDVDFYLSASSKLTIVERIRLKLLRKVKIRLGSGQTLNGFRCSAHGFFVKYEVGAKAGISCPACEQEDLLDTVSLFYPL
jgi:hypothetical protein